MPTTETLLVVSIPDDGELLVSIIDGLCQLENVPMHDLPPLSDSVCIESINGMLESCDGFSDIAFDVGRWRVRVEEGALVSFSPVSAHS